MSCHFERFYNGFVCFICSVLKDMVRDLEQIKENDESQLITKKEKGSSSNNGGHHCKSLSSELIF